MNSRFFISILQTNQFKGTRDDNISNLGNIWKKRGYFYEILLNPREGFRTKDPLSNRRDIDTYSEKQRNLKRVEDRIHRIDKRFTRSLSPRTEEVGARAALRKCRGGKR